MELIALVVDDEIEVVETVSASLLGLKIFDSVITATTSEGALQECRSLSKQPGIIFSDLILNGEICLEMLKEIKRSNPISVIIPFTGYPDKLFTRDLLSLPIDDFMLKPFTMDELERVAFRACITYIKNIRQTKCILEKINMIKQSLEELRSIEEKLLEFVSGHMNGK
jgi:two-component system response regulator YesN